MNINITGLNVDVDPNLREFTKKKIHNRLKTHGENITSIQLTLDTNKQAKIAEAKIHVPGNTIYAKGESNKTIIAAIDALIDKLVRQLRKYKEKHADHR